MANEFEQYAEDDKATKAATDQTHKVDTACPDSEQAVNELKDQPAATEKQEGSLVTELCQLAVNGRVHGADSTVDAICERMSKMQQRSLHYDVLTTLFAMLANSFSDLYMVQPNY